MKEKWTRILVLNLPYFIMFYLVNRGAWLFRHCTGDSQIERLGVMLINFRWCSRIFCRAFILRIFLRELQLQCF